MRRKAEKLDNVLILSEGDSVSCLKLSSRVINIFTHNGVRTIKDFLALSKEEMEKFRGFGAKSIAEVCACQKIVRKGLSQSQETSRQGLARVKKAIIDFMGEKQGYIVLRQLDGQAAEDENRRALWDIKEFRKAITAEILAVIKDNGKTLSEIMEIIPKEIFSEGGLKGILSEMAANGQIGRNGYTIVAKKPTLFEYIHSISNEKYRKAFLLRVEGHTLQEIGEELGLSRERIRQMISKLTAQKPELEDDEFLNIWNKYPHLKDEYFIDIFDWPKERIGYFYLITSSNSRAALTNHRLLCDDLKRLKEDYSNDPVISEKMQNLVYGDTPRVLTGKKQIIEDRMHFIRFAVERFCQDCIRYKDFVLEYMALISSLELEVPENLSIDSVELKNHLRNADFVLWSADGKMRFYDINSVDPEALLKAIHFDMYMDTEISVQKIFKDNAEAMKSYDIRTAPELYDLLEKILSRKAGGLRDTLNCKVSFGKKLLISIGDADRTKQLFDLLVRNSPINEFDLAKKYANAYGVTVISALDMYEREFWMYRHGNGIFIVNRPKRRRKPKM